MNSGAPAIPGSGIAATGKYIGGGTVGCDEVGVGIIAGVGIGGSR